MPAPVARVGDAQALLVELAGLAGRAAHGIRRRAHACLVETLRAWLDAFGDVIAASAAVHTHPNTFRYRLRRLAEVGGIDLTDRTRVSPRCWNCG